MKSKNILDAMTYVDSDMIEDAENFKKQRHKKTMWTKFVCAAGFILIIAVTAISVLPLLSRPQTDNNGVYWIDNRPRNTKYNISMSENGIVWPWNCMEVYEQFQEIQFNNALYTTRSGYTGSSISKELIERKIGEGTANGYDIYNDEEHHIDIEIYSIKKVDSERFVAVQYDASEQYYVFMKHTATYARTLGELIKSINLDEYCELTNLYLYEKANGADLHYALNENGSRTLWQIIAKKSDAELVLEPINFEGQNTVSFVLTSEVLGSDNLSLEVYDNGYLKTNIENFGYYFYIGSEAADEILNFVLDHKIEAVDKKEPEVLIGIVTEIGNDYIKVDDSIMMKNPNDGIEFTVYANHTRIKRYITSGFLKVGQQVLIEHAGIYSEEHTVVRTATGLYEAYISEDGEVLIPE